MNIKRIAIGLASLALTWIGAPAAPAAAGETATAILAGGCFWCMEAPFEKLPGVESVTSGFSGGHDRNPSYEAVSRGGTGHAEVVRIVYDPQQISYAKLLHVFWRNIDPLTANAQFCDRGSQYRSAIFYLDEEQKKEAWASRREIESRLPGQIVTEIVPAGPFFAAEGYHQDFYKKNPDRYQSYRQGCGRDRRLRQLWGDEAGGEH